MKLCRFNAFVGPQFVEIIASKVFNLFDFPPSDFDVKHLYALFTHDKQIEDALFLVCKYMGCNQSTFYVGIESCVRSKILTR